jgi:hypothetical protein
LSPRYQRNAVTWGSRFVKATAAGAAAAGDEAATSAKQGPQARQASATADQGSRPQPQRAVVADAEAEAAAAAGEGASAPGDVTVLATGDIHAPSFLTLPEMPRMPSIPL